jgi:hypothetical protein
MIADSNKFKFKNNTGGKITITSEVRSNTTFTHTSHKNKVLKDGESVEYVVTPSMNLNTFQYYGAVLHIHYKTEGNETGKHSIGVAHLESCNATMPTSIQVSFAFGKDGLPRMYILRRQSGKYNGQSFYMDDKAKMKLYFEWENTTLAGKSAYGTSMGWRIDYHGRQIAKHDGISKKEAVLSEDVVRAFPLDCSYYGDISLCNEKPVKGIFDGHYTESDSSRNIYSTWKAYAGGFNSGEGGTGGNKLRYLHIAYRDQVSFTKLSDSNFSKVKSSNSFKNIIHIPFGGTNNPEPGRPAEGNEKFYHPERTYELDAGVGSNEYPSNVLYEWEIITAKKAVQGDYQPLLGGRGHRFVTQYSKFTINLNDMGLTWQPRSVDNRWSDWDNQEIAEVRFRVLGSLTENKTDKVNGGFAGRQGSWSRWRSIPRLGWVDSLRTFTHGGKFWLGGSLGSVDNYGSEPGPSTETDCGWDGRLVARVQTTNRKTTYWHPLISVNSRLMLCTNKNKEALLYSGKYNITLFFHTGLDFDNDYPNTAGAHRDGIKGLRKMNYTISASNHAIKFSPAEALQRDPSLYRGHAKDGERDWNATGTFKTGYECCEVASNTDLKVSGFMFNIHTQKCSNFDRTAINRELNGAGSKGESIMKYNRGEMAYYDTAVDSLYNSYQSTIPGHGDVDFSGKSGNYMVCSTNTTNYYAGEINLRSSTIRHDTLGNFIVSTNNPMWPSTPNVYAQQFKAGSPMTGIRHPNIEYTNIRGFVPENHCPVKQRMGWNEGGIQWNDGTQWPFMGPGHFEKSPGGSRLGRVQMYDNGHNLGHGRGETFGGDHAAHLAGWSQNKHHIGDLRYLHQHIDNGVDFDPNKCLDGMRVQSWGVKGRYKYLETSYDVNEDRWFSMKPKGSWAGRGDSQARMSIWYENSHPTDTAILSFGMQAWQRGNDTSVFSIGIYDDKTKKKIYGPGALRIIEHDGSKFAATMDARGQSHPKCIFWQASGSDEEHRWFLSGWLTWGTHFMIPPGKRYRFCLLAGLSNGWGHRCEAVGYRCWGATHQGYKTPSGTYYNG